MIPSETSENELIAEFMETYATTGMFDNAADLKANISAKRYRDIEQAARNLLRKCLREIMKEKSEKDVCKYCKKTRAEHKFNGLFDSCDGWY